jgi:predicted nucleic acid-binding protein
MDIILDTNTIVNDYYFKSEKIESLFLYLDITGSKLIITELVRDELISKFKREISHEYKNIDSTNDYIKRIANLGDDLVNVKEKEEIFDDYLSFWHDFLI